MTTPSATICPSCGTSTPSGTRFCASCGAALSAEAPAAAPLAQPHSPPAAAAPALPANVTDAAVKARRFSPAMFGAILLCFLLSFVTVSCEGANFQLTFSGTDLMFGKVVEGEEFEPLTSARLAFLAALVGLGVSFMRLPLGAILSAAAALFGIAAMLFIRRAFDALVRAQDADLVVMTIGYEPGYYLAFALFFIVMAVNLVVVAPQRNRV
ncbi:MAG: zinc ribbon domain-containing protein [Candidatus Viridilinea halotolerans]|uniref:Zinc ribbon domain-containing protein n=1 Tax=Candidatus Viridilinea halotolerans TaxID=2491704 RepID=A0A426TTS1_9CHLR|nr:MAG: zinc ribbon domain-containing protein [Candidatus Viridilinea halotolerans]